jgi:methylthioribulose-1-phosphate dehydratase
MNRFADIPLVAKQRVIRELSELKSEFAARGWFAGTSGNMSMRIGDFAPVHFHFAITTSGKDKSWSTAEDFLFVDQNGKPCESTWLKPSAETVIHCEIYRLTG